MTLDDVVVASKLPGAAVGSVIRLGADGVEHGDVRLVGAHGATLVGQPLVPGAFVSLVVEEQTQDKKIIVFKKRRRKNSRRRNGHRRSVTVLRCIDIEDGGRLGLEAVAE